MHRVHSRNCEESGVVQYTWPLKTELVRLHSRSGSHIQEKLLKKNQNWKRENQEERKTKNKNKINKKRKKNPFLILGSKIRSSLFPQLFPSCALDTKPFASSAITTERNLIYFGRFICAFTLGLSLTPEQSSSGQPPPSEWHLFNATSPDSRPLHPDSYPFHDFIPCTVGNGSFNPDCTDKTNSSSLPGATGFTNTSM